MSLKQKYFKSPVTFRITVVTLIFIGISIKLILLPVRTGDFVGFLQPWLDFIRTHGYFHALSYGFYDYTPSYMYLLVLIAKTGFNSLFLVKLVSIVFEYLAAFFIGKIAALKTKSVKTVWISLAVVPLLPTVLLNSSYLSQCDSIYASFVFGAVYFLLRDKRFLSVVFLGLSFALKMQAIMLLPFFFVVMLQRKIDWYYFLIIPVVYFLSLIPAWWMGRPLNELLTIYFSQSGHYPFLTLNFPNLYIFIDNRFYKSVKLIGIVFTFLFTLIAGWWLSRKKYRYTFENLIQLAFLSAVVIPFILPGMHERYMYMGDILGVLYFLVLRKKIYLPTGIVLLSLYSYIHCSRYSTILPMWPAFAVYLTIIILLIIDFLNDLKNITENAEK